MKSSQAVEAKQSQIGLLQAGIILLGLISAFIHLIVLNVRLGGLDIPFTLSGIGYLAFLAALYLPLPVARENRRLVRWAFIGFTALNILAWLFIAFLPAMQSGNGYSDTLGTITKLVEVGLITLLWLEGRQ